MSDDVLYEKIITENEIKGHQLRLVVNWFKDVQYVHLRKYYQNFDGDWLPTKEGASMPATIGSIYALLDGLIDICSNEESVDSINKHFSEKLRLLSENMPGP